MIPESFLYQYLAMGTSIICGYDYLRFSGFRGNFWIVSVIMI